MLQGGIKKKALRIVSSAMRYDRLDVTSTLESPKAKIAKLWEST